MTILQTAQNRYTTKAYDESKTIPQETFLKLLEILRLTPSSINIQPWHFFIADSAEAKARVAYSMPGRFKYNASKVFAASHTIVFCTRKDVTEEHLNHLNQQDELSGRYKDEASKVAQQSARQGYVDLYKSEDYDLDRWLENQTFIALGQLLLAAAAENIDATAIGGFDAKLLDEQLNLTEKGLYPSVVVTLGYRSEDDANAKLAKSRLQDEYIFTTI
ncbi:oxygen-insensitive NAD(P)H nitroreductase [Acinetobacter apis]|uniref:Nitroreductase / dihydropteridine reductase n=1 Tax=Acinetobacter apis TaxID=1229165 RepID=A0A217ED83_9GAMM|nr:oxygen-insensitive NAD(P)H nitroreductase [Acinetobacter apis]SNQ28478.1 nitroreductase / dihydropteridine reductase [Acinetobacter apis]